MDKEEALTPTGHMNLAILCPSRAGIPFCSPWQSLPIEGRNPLLLSLAVIQLLLEALEVYAACSLQDRTSCVGQDFILSCVWLSPSSNLLYFNIYLQLLSCHLDRTKEVYPLPKWWSFHYLKTVISTSRFSLFYTIYPQFFDQTCPLLQAYNLI